MIHFPFSCWPHCTYDVIWELLALFRTLIPFGTKDDINISAGGDIVPSKQQKNEDEEPTNIMNAKPQGQSNNGGSNDNAGNGVAQTGQQKPPSGQKPQPIPALKPIGQPSPGKNERKRKHKKKKQRKEKND